MNSVGGVASHAFTKRKISFAQVHLSCIITAASFMREKINSKLFCELKLLTFQIAGYIGLFGIASTDLFLQSHIFVVLVLTFYAHKNI